MARPRLGEEERRRRTIGVRVTEAEETELRALGQRVRSAVERRSVARVLNQARQIQRQQQRGPERDYGPNR